MSGYRPYMAGAREAAIRANKAAFARAMADYREEFREYRAESRACGYEVETFDQWLLAMYPNAAAEAFPDTLSPKAAAIERAFAGGRTLSDACYYGDTY